MTYIPPPPPIPGTPEAYPINYTALIIVGSVILLLLLAALLDHIQEKRRLKNDRLND